MDRQSSTDAHVTDFITEDGMGAVFMHDIEQVLGGGLTQPCEVHVYGAGQLAFGAAFAAETLEAIARRLQAFVWDRYAEPGDVASHRKSA